MKNRVLVVVSSCGITLPHITLEREIIETHFKDVNKKILLKCNGSLPSCYINPVHNILACALCKTRTDDILQNSGLFDAHIAMKRYTDLKHLDTTDFKEADDLKNVFYKDIDIGRGIMSSIISRTRNHNIDFKKFENHIDQMFSQSRTIIDQFEALVDKEKVTDVLIFNGRFFESYPIMSFCRKKGIDFYTHEKGTTFNKYQLIKNNTVHSIEHRKVEMEKVWEEHGNNSRDIAEKWFEDKSKGAVKGLINFLGDQEEGKIPANFNATKTNIAIFNSSEDEYKSILEWEHDLYKDQNEIIIRICKTFEGYPDFRFYLRFHPNLKGIADQQISELKNASLKNLIIIPPQSAVSTYELMRVCDKVLTFGSSTTIEAAYMGTPSILYGSSFFQTLSSVYVPKDYDTLIDYLKEPKLEARQGDDLLKAALFLKEKGQTVQQVKIESKNKVYINNKLYKPNPVKILMNLISQMGDFNIWRKSYSLYRNKRLSLRNWKEL